MPNQNISVKISIICVFSPVTAATKDKNPGEDTKTSRTLYSSERDVVEQCFSNISYHL